jgi:hypothetical protein
LLGVLYYLSASVEVPPPDLQSGLVTVSLDDAGRPFAWSQVTGKVMTIHSQEGRPENAYVAVPYRDWWFYIADDDQSSKATFSLLNILFSLQSATGKGKSTAAHPPGRKVKSASTLAPNGRTPNRRTAYAPSQLGQQHVQSVAPRRFAHRLPGL